MTGGAGSAGDGQPAPFTNRIDNAPLHRRGREARTGKETQGSRGFAFPVQLS